MKKQKKVPEKVVKKESSPVVRRVKKVGLISLLLVATLVVLDFSLAAISLSRWTRPDKVYFEKTPADYGIDYYSFSLETPSGTVYGWKMAAQQPIDPDADDWVYTTEYSDKTIVFASNYDGNREILDLGGADYFAQLCAAGYNVFTFDWTGSGFSDGKTNAFCLNKVEELQTVLDYVKEETESSFIALYGIGFGCHSATEVASLSKDVDALVLDSCYESFHETFFGNFSAWSPLDIAPFRGTVSLLFPLFAGVNSKDVALTDAMNRMNGKSVMFIQGELDELFGYHDAEHLAALAKIDNEVTTWFVAEATHLRARSYDSEIYLKKVTEFLDKAYEKEHGA